MEPKHSSLAGGRLVTVKGFGFASDTETPVKMINDDLRIEIFAGDVRCHVQKVSKNEVRKYSFEKNKKNFNKLFYRKIKI